MIKKIIFLLLILIPNIVSAQTFVKKLVVDSTDVYIDTDAQGNLIFKDRITAQKKLSELIAAGGSAYADSIVKADRHVDGDSLMTIVEIITSIRDSLDIYRTNYELDTIKVHIAQWQQFIRNHQNVAADSNWQRITVSDSAYIDTLAVGGKTYNIKFTDLDFTGTEGFSDFTDAGGAGADYTDSLRTPSGKWSADKWLDSSGKIDTTNIAAHWDTYVKNHDVDVSGLMLKSAFDDSLAAHTELLEWADTTNTIATKSDVRNKKLYFTITIPHPDSLINKSYQDSVIVWTNNLGATFTIDSVLSWSAADNYKYRLTETTRLGSSPQIIKSITVSTDAAGFYYNFTGVITHATIEDRRVIWFKPSSDHTKWVTFSIIGHYTKPL